MPVYATLFMIVMLSSIGLPLLNGFIGEFTILQGAFEANWHWAAWAVVGIVLGAAYMLWLYQRTMFGACENPKNQVLKDLNLREIMTLVPLIVWAFWIGLYPKPFFNVLDKPVTAIVQRVNPDFYRPSANLKAPSDVAPASAGLKAGAPSGISLAVADRAASGRAPLQARTTQPPGGVTR
jgi:NADH-quinone oxidoreductase subunit M